MTSAMNCSEQTGRHILTAVGGLIVLAGLRRGSWAGSALALVGGAMLLGRLRNGCVSTSDRDRAAHLARFGAGVTAGIYDQVAQAAKEERHPAGTLIEDVVEEASDDSFPCSDPPAWTAR